jgi:hypothetical protein
MILGSKDIENRKPIDSMFTCDGGDISPHLSWKEFPEHTKSFALMLIDNDGDMGIIGHWYVINIPRHINKISRGGSIPGEVIENDFKNEFYQGPCPKSGSHKYTLKIFALSEEKFENINSLNFRRIMRKRSIDSGELNFSYERKMDFRSFRFYSCHSCD